MQAKITRVQRGSSVRRLATGAAVAAALAGCVAMPGFAFADSGAKADRAAQKAGKKLDKAILAAERAAAHEPRSAEARVRLGQAYLAAGRFASAGTSFEDAVALGDKSPATALAMSLAYIGTGRTAEANALLGQWRETIPVGDYALALALGGQPAQAAAILTDTIKQGDNTAKIRQNLAYAFALDGRLQESRVVAAQDVPADQLDARVSGWALQAGVGSAQSRVAALLGAPVRSDPGQPAQLALAEAHARPALAANDAVPAPPQNGELPALEAAPVVAQVAASEPAQPVTQLASYEPAHGVWTDAVATPAERSSVARHVAKPAKSQASRKVAVSAVKSVANRRSGTHVVQLGSFASEEGAKRAWNLFVLRDASLKGREMRITQATVNGRRFWRVAAAGYDASAARAKCSTVRGQGKECLAYAGGGGPFRPRVLMAVAERN